MKCFDCPRKCGVNRKENLGFCGEGQKIRISKIIENFMWEEPIISGEKGALAIFFSGCNLRCEYCQNYQISHLGKGEYFSPEEFAEKLKSYDYKKYTCVDLITPTHFSSLLLEAFKIFKPPVPIVWNTSGYESIDTLKKIDNFIDVYLTDFKYYSSDISKRLSKAEDYFQVAKSAVTFMINSKPNYFEGGILKQGVIIRHLVLPGEVKDSIKLLDEIKALFGNPIISLMQQFTPIGRGEKNRKLYPLEFKAVLAHADKLGLNNGFIQDECSSDQKYIPNF